jgi:hypothetical protein
VGKNKENIIEIIIKQIRRAVNIIFPTPRMATSAGFCF